MGDCQCLSYVDQVVGDHAESDPALYAFGTSVAASAQSMAALDDADTSFAAGSPRLRLPEPAALFELFPLRTMRVSVRHRYPAHTQFLRCSFVCPRIEAGIGCDQPRQATEDSLVRFNGGQQQF